jgi:hypothetical protein
MIWIILYIICIAICCGIILYTENIEFKDGDSVLAVMVSIFWPIYLVICTILGLGHCIKLLLIRILETKK